MQIGQYQLYEIETGRFRLDGGAMFGVVPKVFWQKTNPADESNRIELAMRALLIVGEGKKILVDCGAGDHWPEKFKQIFAIDHSQYSLEKSLQQRGYELSDITDVILTHLHFDHAGGAVIEKDGQKVPRFPNAIYHVQHQHLAHAVNPTPRDKASFVQETFVPLSEKGQQSLSPGGEEIFPNITVIPVHGHTPYQQMVKIQGDEQVLLYCADLIPTSSHIPVPYVMGFDLYPVTTVEEKLHFLPQASKEQWLLFFEHDPQICLGKVKKTEKGFALDKSWNSLEEYSQSE